jgi:hypothetical protein
MRAEPASPASWPAPEPGTTVRLRPPLKSGAGVVVKHEGAGAACQCGGDQLESAIGGGPAGHVHHQHLALASPFDLAFLPFLEPGAVDPQVPVVRTGRPVCGHTQGRHRWLTSDFAGYRTHRVTQLVRYALAY